MKEFGRKPYLAEGLTYPEFIGAVTNAQIDWAGYTFKRLEMKKPYESGCSNPQFLHYFRDPLAWKNAFKFDSPLSFAPYVETEEPKSPETPETPATTTFNLWFAGKDWYGCFGMGGDYSVSYVSGTEYQYLTISGDDKYTYSSNPSDTPPDQPPTYACYAFGYEFHADFVSCTYKDTIPGWELKYSVDSSSLPASISWGGNTYNYDSYDAGTNEYSYKSAEPKSYVYVSWPIRQYKGLTVAFTPVWAHTNGHNSFLIDSEHRMWVAGSNHCGCLGIGQQTGHYRISNDGNVIPNYYAKTFVQVPGEWSMVAGPLGLSYPYVWAMKTDGTVWTAGGSNGGLGTDELIFRPVFTKASDDTFRIIFNYGGTLFALKDAVDSYDLYMSDGAGGLTLYMNLSEEDFAAAIGANVTPEQYASAAQGMFSPGIFDGGIYTFIGGDPYSDKDSKAAGTLWYRINDEEIVQIKAGTSGWTFTAGVPELSDSTVSGGAHIAISSVAV